MHTIEACRGVTPCPGCRVAKIKALYKELKLKEMFDQYEEESYKVLSQKIDVVLIGFDSQTQAKRQTWRGFFLL